jgi:OmpA-OmpF porin, OOP family
MRIVIIILFLAKLSCSQSLIYNGGFEEYKKCPNDVCEIEKALGWKNQNKGTGDYFNSCSNSRLVSVPNNFAGSSLAHGGNAYIGFGYFVKEKNIELIQTKLTQHLIINKRYCLQLYIKKPNKYRFSFNQLSFLFSKQEIISNNMNFYDENQIKQNDLIVYNVPSFNKDEWLKICINYISKDESQFLTIGFNIPKNVNVLHPQAIKNGSYYYIDDISLIEIKDDNECICNEVNPIKKDSIKVQIVKSYYDSSIVKPLVLQNIVFERNKSKLLPASNTELDNLVNYLKINSTKVIELFGYTDNTGKEINNLKLSEARVKSVAEYLNSKGIENKRIKFKGYGSKNPLMPNNSEINKSKNRRVEFKIK